MALNFPTAPTPGLTYEAEGVSYEYVDGRWRVLGLSGDLYLPLTGGTLTNDLTIESPFPYLRLNETDQPVGLRTWSVGVTGGDLLFNTRNEDGTVQQTYAAIRRNGAYQSDIDLLPAGLSDARYARLAGGNDFSDTQATTGYMRAGPVPANWPGTPPRIAAIWGDVPKSHSYSADVELLVERPTGVAFGIVTEDASNAAIYFGDEANMTRTRLQRQSSNQRMEMYYKDRICWTTDGSQMNVYSTFSGSGTVCFTWSSTFSGQGVKAQILGSGNLQNVNNSYGSISDERLKHDITDVSPQLDDLRQLRVVNFRLNDHPDLKQVGLIAQEVQQVKPGLIDEMDDGYLGVKYSVLVPLLLKALQETHEIIDELREDVAALKGAA